jgi:hypothetical protein
VGPVGTMLMYAGGSWGGTSRASGMAEAGGGTRRASGKAGGVGVKGA